MYELPQTLLQLSALMSLVCILQLSKSEPNFGLNIGLGHGRSFATVVTSQGFRSML